MQSWQLQDAKARMSELVKRAQEASQRITLHGKPVAAVVSQATFDALSQARGSLAEFMRPSPLHGSDEPAFERDRSRTRKSIRL